MCLLGPVGVSAVVGVSSVVVGVSSVVEGLSDVVSVVGTLA